MDLDEPRLFLHLQQCFGALVNCLLIILGQRQFNRTLAMSDAPNGLPDLHPLATPQINAEKSPFLVEKLQIWMLPTLALVKKEKVVDYVVGFDDMGGTDDFTTEILENRLAAVEMIKTDGLGPRPPVQGQQRSVRSGIYTKTESDEDSDFDD